MSFPSVQVVALEGQISPRKADLTIFGGLPATLGHPLLGPSLITMCTLQRGSHSSCLFLGKIKSEVCTLPLLFYSFPLAFISVGGICRQSGCPGAIPVQAMAACSSILILFNFHHFNDIIMTWLCSSQQVMFPVHSKHFLGFRH